MYFATGASLTAAIAALPSATKGNYNAFDPFFYSPLYMGSYSGSLSPIEHFVQIGAARGYKPNADFDPAYYKALYADLRNTSFDSADLLYHYVASGLNEGRIGNATLASSSWSGYLTAYPDVATYVNANLASFGGSTTNGAVAHYAKFGQYEGRAVPGGPSSGQTFTLTNGFDATGTIKGDLGTTSTAGDNIFNANVVTDPATGLATIETLTAIDVIDGGAGTDTLNYITVGATALPTGAAISNIEIINMTSDGAATADVSGFKDVTTLSAKAVAGAVDIDTKSNVTSVTVTGTATTVAIDDAGTGTTTTADKIKTVSVTGNTGALTIGATNAVDTLTSLSLASSAQNATVTATAGTRALALSINGLTGGVLQDGEATTLAVTSSGTATTGITLNAAKATTVSIDAAIATTVADVNIAAATTLTATGAALTTITATTTVTALTKLDASGSTGGLAVTAAIGTGVEFVGGAGKDSVSLGATTKTINMAAGDDTVTVSADFGALGTVDAGGDSDTLKMTATLAANDSLSANTKFADKISNFENLELTGTNVTKTINMTNLDSLTKVTLAAGATAITIDNLTNGSTVVLLGANTANVVNIKDASLGGSNSDNLKLNTTIATSGASVNFGTFTSAGLETLNLDATRTGTAVAADINRVDLTVANIQTVNVTGNVIADLTNAALTAATLQTVNGSTNTGGLRVSTAGATQGVTITGSATKANTLTGGDGGDAITGGAGIDTIVANGGADTIIGGGGADVITGGTGVDTIDVGAGVAGDTIVLGATAAVLIAANRDVVTNFAAGATLTDVIRTTIATFDAQNTSQDGAADFAAVTVGLTAGAQAYVSGVDIETVSVIEIETTLSSNGNLALTTAEGLNGTELLKALSSTTTAATNITVTNATAGGLAGFYIAAYQNGNAYIYYATATGGDALFIASEIALVGVLNGVTANALVAGNFTGV